MLKIILALVLIFFQSTIFSAEKISVISSCLSSLSKKQIKLVDPLTLDQIKTEKQLKETVNSLSEYEQYLHLNLNVLTQDLITLSRIMERYARKGFWKKSNISYLHNPDFVAKQLPTESYQSLYKKLAPEIDFFNILYSHLAERKTLEKANYLDPDDAKHNDNIQTKFEDLIFLLASIKNRQDNSTLTQKIYVNRQINFSTSGNSNEWFSEMRYKLFYLSQIVKNLNEEGKINLLSHFLHAGRHCSDAKKKIISDLFIHFHPQQALLTDKFIYGNSSKLDSKLYFTAYQQKSLVLSNIIDQTLDTYPEDSRIIRERLSSFQATWDYFSPYLGLNLLGSNYPSFSVALLQSPFSEGSYTPKRLITAVIKDHSEEIEKFFFRSARPFLQFSREDLIASFLRDKNILLEKRGFLNSCQCFNQLSSEEQEDVKILARKAGSFLCSKADKVLRKMKSLDLSAKTFQNVYLLADFDSLQELNLNLKQKKNLNILQELKKIKKITFVG